MKFLLKENPTTVLDNLVANELISQQDLARIKKITDDTKEDLFEYLIEHGLIEEEKLVKIVAEINGIPYVDLAEIDINPKTLEKIPRDIAQRHKAVCLGKSGDTLVVAMDEADNIQKVRYLSKTLATPISVYMASKTGVLNVLGQYEVKIDMEGVANQLQKEQTEAAEKKKPTSSFLSPLRRGGPVANIDDIAAESPASNALTNILQYSVVNRASDIHIEALEHCVRVRVRIDGVLREVARYPKELEAALIAKVKILSQLKVDEKRLPQDGEFVINVRNRNIDLRVATSPVVWGEQVIIRILDRTGTVMGLENLGYCGQTLEVIQEALKQSSGMILTSGPTGSGKTTSLYTLIQEIMSDSIKIITLEDPPEYKMDGVNQIQVNSHIGLTFSAGLRSILRQDPDVVMVGEIRDEETASLAIQASLTGHLVFSTLHTNSAAGILPRLLDMGIEPFLISSTIRVVIGQRLLRRNRDSEEEYTSNINETESIKTSLKGVLPSKSQPKEEVIKMNERLGYFNLPFIEDPSYKLFRGSGSDPNDKYKGRVGIYEAFPISDDIQKLIIDRATSSAIQAQAQKEGMITMRQDGYLKALSGQTTTTEVDRVIAENNV